MDSRLKEPTGCFVSKEPLRGFETTVDEIWQDEQFQKEFERYKEEHEIPMDLTMEDVAYMNSTQNSFDFPTDHS